MSRAEMQLSQIMKPFDKWRLDPGTDEICFNQPNQVFVRARGEWAEYESSLDYDDLYDIAILAGSLNNQNISEEKPLLAADMPNGERLMAIIPPSVPQGTVSLTFRIHSSRVSPMSDVKKRYNTSRWNKWTERKKAAAANNKILLAAYDSGDIELFFREVIRLRLSPILCGATGAGKTSMLKTMMSSMGIMERLITIEDALELDIVAQRNHVRLLYSRGQQSTSNVTQTHLLEAYTRMRPDRGSIGEISSPESAYIYGSEILTGHPGSPSTIHGKDASQAALRLFNLYRASEGGKNFKDEAVISQLGLSVDVIIPFVEDKGVYSIGEVWFAADAERRGQSFKELLEG